MIFTQTQKKKTKAKNELRKAERNLQKIVKGKGPKAQLKESKLKKAANKALQKVLEKQTKQTDRKEKILKKQKSKLLELEKKKLPYEFDQLKLPKTQPKWLPDWMYVIISDLYL